MRIEWLCKLDVTAPIKLLQRGYTLLTAGFTHAKKPPRMGNAVHISI